MELAARSCFTFLHFNPSDEQTRSNLQYYRFNLSLTEDEFIYRDTTIEEYQKPYKKGNKQFTNVEIRTYKIMWYKL